MDKNKVILVLLGVVFLGLLGFTVFKVIDGINLRNVTPTPELALTQPTQSFARPQVAATAPVIDPTETSIAVPTNPATNIPANQANTGGEIKPPFNKLTLRPWTKWTVIAVKKLAWRHDGVVSDLATFSSDDNWTFLAFCAEPGKASPHPGWVYTLTDLGRLWPDNDPDNLVQDFIVIGWVFLK